MADAQAPMEQVPTQTSDVQGQIPMQPEAPAPGADYQPPVPPHRSFAAQILGGIADVLGGKTRTQYGYDDQGNFVSGEVKNTRGQQVGNILSNFAVGAGRAAMTRPGPGFNARATAAGAAAGVERQQGLDLLHRQQASEAFQSRQRAILQQATIDRWNQEQLLARQAEGRLSVESQNRINDANRHFTLTLQSEGIEPYPIMVDGKDINGKPGNESDMKAHFSDIANHGAPAGYSLLYLPQVIDGKIAETAYKVPVNAMKKVVEVPSPLVAQAFGVKPEGDTVPMTLQDAGNVVHQVLDTELKGAQSAAAEARAKAEPGIAASEEAKNYGEAAKTKAEAEALGGDVIHDQAKQLVEGNLDPSQLSKRAASYAATLAAANAYSLSTYGKPFDIAQAQSDYRFATTPATQNTLKYLNSLVGSDNKSGNLGEVVKISDKLNRTEFPAINNAEAWARLQTGDPLITQYRAAIVETADQIAKIMQGGGTGSATSDAKLKQATEILDKKFTKDQIKGVAETMRDLLGNRKKELIGNNRYLSKQYATSQAPNAAPVYMNGQLLGYTTDGKTMTPAK